MGLMEELVFLPDGGSEKSWTNVYSPGLKGLESPDISNICKNVCNTQKVNTKNLILGLWV